jgi:hypothetical protein
MSKTSYIIKRDMKNTNTSITTMGLDEIADFYIPANAPKNVKSCIVENYLDTTRYEFLGFVDRSNTAILRQRFHNVRDNNGRFAKIRNSRRAR